MNQLEMHWLTAVPWETLLTVNQALCQAKQVASQHNQKTYEPARQIWERARPVRMSLRQVLDVCRECSTLTPFVFNNGNTFAAISKTLLEDTLKSMPPVEAQIIRTTVAHYVNGLVDKKELVQILAHFEVAWQKAHVATPPPSGRPAEQRFAG